MCLRRLERLVRPAPAPHPQRRLPADGDGRRPDQRDHVDAPRCASRRCARPTSCSATTTGAPTGSPRTARARPPTKQVAAEAAARERLGAQTTRAPARAAGRRARRRRPRPAALPARRQRGPRPERDADLRRRELERDRDRLDLRRPRHLQEVQGARIVSGDVAGRHRRSARVHDRGAARRLAARLPRQRAGATS